MKRLVTTSVDKGWFGLRPLRSHVVVCGFPRSGSTLLQLQIETCISDVRVFGKEYWAPAACQYVFRNHPYMITKAPWDVFFVDELRAYYASRQANVRFIVTVRDPRRPDLHPQNRCQSVGWLLHHSLAAQGVLRAHTICPAGGRRRDH